MDIINKLGTREFFSSKGLLFICIAAGLLCIIEAMKPVDSKVEIPDAIYIAWEKCRKVGCLTSGICFILFAICSYFLPESNLATILLSALGFGIFGGAAFRIWKKYQIFHSISEEDEPQTPALPEVSDEDEMSY